MLTSLLVAGREFDKDGNLRPWWEKDVIKRFQERAQCMVDQYSSYTLNGEKVGRTMLYNDN
jgi:predicted metalloendopeptidase